MPRAPWMPARLAALDNVRIIGTAGGGQSVTDKPIGPSHLDEISAALADFVDLASPFTRGHSTRVAKLAEAAALNAGLGRETRRLCGVRARSTTSAWSACRTGSGSSTVRSINRSGSGFACQIARELQVAQATVHTHVINLYGKIGVNTRAGATLFAFENDLIDSPSR